MKYAHALILGGILLFAAARYWMLDILVFEAAIAAVAFGITWIFLLLKKREAEQLAASEDVTEKDGRCAA